MASRTPTEQLLHDYVKQFAEEPDPGLIAKYWNLCDAHGHFPYGPIFQYKVDNHNLGCHLIRCHENHPGDVEHPGPLHVPVSKALTAFQRRLIREFRLDSRITVDGKPMSKRAIAQLEKVPKVSKPKTPAAKPRAAMPRATKSTSSTKSRAKKSASSAQQPSQITAAPAAAAPAAAKESLLIDLTDDAALPPTPPRAPLSRSPSVEIISFQPAPAPLSQQLEVWYFYENEKEPTSFILKARPARAEFRFRQYEAVLLAFEIKQTDLITVLTTATATERTWSSFRVSDLRIPRTQTKIVISRPRVQKPDDCITRYYAYAYSEAVNLPKRILPLP
ncbi:unnamed protein product [Peniophora sp. CBMAI 1063]|nr:unnamed protein product [Peniophora sp. CBMAI 1063]